MTTLTTEKPATEQIIAAVLDELGPPISNIQTEAFAAFDAKEYAKVRVLAASNLSDSYIRALTIYSWFAQNNLRF